MKEVDSIVLKNLGRKIREIRLQKNLTQKELAFILDVEISQISRIETGKISTSILSLIKIAEAFEIKVNELLKEIH